MQVCLFRTAAVQCPPLAQSTTAPSKHLGIKFRSLRFRGSHFLKWWRSDHLDVPREDHPFTPGDTPLLPASVLWRNTPAGPLTSYSYGLAFHQFLRGASCAAGAPSRSRQPSGSVAAISYCRAERPTSILADSKRTRRACSYTSILSSHIRCGTSSADYSGLQRTSADYSGQSPAGVCSGKRSQGGWSGVCCPWCCHSSRACRTSRHTPACGRGPVQRTGGGRGIEGGAAALTDQRSPWQSTAAPAGQVAKISPGVAAIGSASGRRSICTSWLPGSRFGHGDRWLPGT